MIFSKPLCLSLPLESELGEFVLAQRSLFENAVKFVIWDVRIGLFV